MKATLTTAPAKAGGNWKIRVVQDGRLFTGVLLNSANLKVKGKKATVDQQVSVKVIQAKADDNIQCELL